MKICMPLGVSLIDKLKLEVFIIIFEVLFKYYFIKHIQCKFFKLILINMYLFFVKMNKKVF